MKKLAYVFFAAGLFLILFPIIREWQYEWNQEKLLADLEQYTLAASQADTDRLLEKRNEQLTEMFVQGAKQDTLALDSAAGNESIQQLVDGDKPALGIIEISKIDLKLPILEGATNENLKFAAAHLEETSKIGEVGNAAIAAHRARTKGRLFNRLNELKTGDEIKVLHEDKQFNYTVFKILRVKPTDISVLDKNDKDQILTLITCDPLVNPTHRLIIQAKI